jgi:hypothetical protein
VTEPADADQLADLRHFVRVRVAAGYDRRDEIVDDAVDSVEGEPNLQPVARRVTDEELAAHLARQAQWPATTDYDRLAAAFADLERSGIVVREDFSCCGNCGSHEIWEEVEAYGEGVRGYAFFHQQDTESAVEGDGLYLSYGATAEGEEASLGVAAEIVAALRGHGFTPAWNGRLSQRIGVSLDWKRRRTVDAAHGAAADPASPFAGRPETLLGKDIRSPEVLGFLAAVDPAKTVRRENGELRWFSRQAGLQVNAERQGIKTLFFYGEGSDGCRQYAGRLPHALRFDMGFAEMAEAIGQPGAANSEGGQYWRLDGYTLVASVKGGRIESFCVYP